MLVFGSVKHQLHTKQNLPHDRGIDLFTELPLASPVARNAQVPNVTEPRGNFPKGVGRVFFGKRSSLLVNDTKYIYIYRKSQTEEMDVF